MVRLQHLRNHQMGTREDMAWGGHGIRWGQRRIAGGHVEDEFGVVGVAWRCVWGSPRGHGGGCAVWVRGWVSWGGEGVAVLALWTGGSVGAGGGE